MAIVFEYIRDAKCKDCKWLKAEKVGKRKDHKCTNNKSGYFNWVLSQNHPVCGKWEILYF